MIHNIEFYAKYFKTPRQREELRQLWQCDNRTVRDNISKLQKDLNIVNLQDGKGWYIPNNSTEILAYARQEYSRGIKSIAKAYKMFKRCGVDYQRNMEEILKDIESEE